MLLPVLHCKRPIKDCCSIAVAAAVVVPHRVAGAAAAMAGRRRLPGGGHGQKEGRARPRGNARFKDGRVVFVPEKVVAAALPAGIN